MAGLTAEMIDELVAESAQLGLLLAGRADADVDYPALKAEMAGSLHQKGFHPETATAIASALVRTSRLIKTEIEQATGVNFRAVLQ
jgi:hypothetical protein